MWNKYCNFLEPRTIYNYFLIICSQQLHRSGPIRTVSRCCAECWSYCIRRRRLVQMCDKTKNGKSQFRSVKHRQIWHPGRNSHFSNIWSRQKRCAATFGAGCTDCQLEISVLGPIREKTVLGSWTVFGSHMAKCCNIYSPYRIYMTPAHDPKQSV